jgi:hypothetical protein
VQTVPKAAGATPRIDLPVLLIRRLPIDRAQELAAAARAGELASATRDEAGEWSAHERHSTGRRRLRHQGGQRFPAADCPHGRREACLRRVCAEDFDAKGEFASGEGVSPRRSWQWLTPAVPPCRVATSRPATSQPSPGASAFYCAHGGQAPRPGHDRGDAHGEVRHRPGSVDDPPGADQRQRADRRVTGDEGVGRGRLEHAGKLGDGRNGHGKHRAPCEAAVHRRRLRIRRRRPTAPPAAICVRALRETTDTRAHG